MNHDNPHNNKSLSVLASLRFKITPAPAWCASLWLAACVCCLFAAQPGRAADTPVNLKEQLRPLWAPAAGAYFRDWLLCGEFSLPATEGGAPVSGYATDFLREHGGEAALRPSAGMAHARVDASRAVWTQYRSLTDIIDYAKAFERHPYENVVWYASTTVSRAQKGQAVFNLSGNCLSKLWLNGKLVHEHASLREAWYDDRFVVSLRDGDNALLVKTVQQSGSGQFSFRVLDMAQAQAMALTEVRLDPVVVTAECNDDTLVVSSDEPRDPLLAVTAPVAISVLAPGGRVIDTQTVTRGDNASFACKEWPAGPYDLRFSMTAPNGKRVLAYQLWYHGDALKAVKQLVASAPGADDRTPVGMNHALLAAMATDRLGPDLDKVKPESLPVVYPELMEFAEARLQQAGGAGPLHGNGFVRLAYRDDSDDSPQFCRVYLPMEYDPDKRYPLIISLHGRDEFFPSYVQWWGSDLRHDDNADQYGAIVAYPFARGNSWFRGIGDGDVMHCLRLLKEHFAVDTERVYLLGYSMGGAGVWYVGTRHPEQFAAIAPFFGGYDFRFQLSDAALQKLTPREQYRRERMSYIAQAEALRSTPVLANHGDADPTVSVEYSRFTLRTLQRWGYDVRYWEHPGKGHGGLDNDETVINWLLAHTREANPAHVSLRSADLRYAAAHWVKIEQRDDPYAFMQADVDIPAPNFIRLNTDNVLEITLTPRAPLVDPDKPVQVVWNNNELRTVRMRDGAISLRAKSYQPAKLHKRPGVEGPANDIYNTPFAIVVGTISPNPLMRRLCERAGQRLLAWWDERFHSQPHVFKDTEISAADQARYSLWLLGGPAENAVAHELAERIPLQIAANAITIDGHVFAVHDTAVQMIYPNPLNPDRYVLLRAATSPAGMFFADYMLNDVDFCLVDSHAADGVIPANFFDAITGRNAGPPIAAGYFDNAWHYQDTLVERWPGFATPGIAQTQVPRRGSALLSTGRLMLADLVESKAEGGFLDMLRNCNALGAALRIGGKRYTSGLAIAPTYWLPKQTTAVEYDLSGGGWTHLRATIALELPSIEVSDDELAHTQYEFVVSGDGKERYHSQPLTYQQSSRQLDVDITGVHTLRLEVVNNTTGTTSVKSVDWADIRLER